MSKTAAFRSRVTGGAPLAGTFMKTPAYQVVEVLAQSGLDFLCLDAEHAPFDRASLDACCAMGRALDLPILIRVGDGSPRELLQALDYGAVGVIVPHVTSADRAAEIARACRFGPGGRGYAGSSRWAGYATSSMEELIALSQDETVVIAQIEDPEAVEVCEDIVATPGIDAVFLGPSDLAVGHGRTTPGGPEVEAALVRVGQAARAAGKGYASFTADAAGARDWALRYGVHMFCVASEHNWLRAGASEVARGIQAIGDPA